MLVSLFACSMAIVYEQQGKYMEALPMHHEVLQIRSKTFGPEHPDVASTYSNIGVVYRQQGQYPEALGMYQKCLEIEEKTYGREHPLVADTKNKCTIFFCTRCVQLID